MIYRFYSFVVVAVAGTATPAQDVGRVRGDSPQTRTRLAEAERKLLDNQSAEAADDLLKLLDDAGDDLVTVDGVTHQPARRIAHGLLARLPADVLRTVRGRIDTPAARLLEQGRTNRDRRPLRLLVDKYFVARPAEAALELLGELLFERGEFRAAAVAWRSLLPGPTTGELKFPDPKGEPASIRAKLILSLIFAGDTQSAGAELVALRDKHPTAAGRLAGKTGTYVSILSELILTPPRVPPDAIPGGDWTAFAGSSNRTGAVTDRLPRYWSSSPTWRTPIPPVAGPPPGTTRAFAAPPRACIHHPVIMDDRAYIADAHRVIGIDLQSGRSVIGYEHVGDGSDPTLPPAGATDYTLTASDDRLYVRFGRPEIPPPADLSGKSKPPSLVVGLVKDRQSGRLRQLWELAPPSLVEGSVVTWEAAPVVANGRVYAAVSRIDGSRVIHSIVAYADPQGRPLWITDVAESPASVSRTRPEPLTLAGDVLVFCSHSGVIAAVDAFTGKPVWAHQYPPTTRHSGPGRDLCPAVYADGRVFAAPTDAGAVIALDCGSGQLLWKQSGIQVDQILGLCRGRLIVTLGGPVRGIRGLDLSTGSSTEPRGWQTHDDPRLGSFGRGLVSEQTILWPTASREGTYLLNASDGTNAGGWQTLREARGNLAYANGVLLVATPTEMMGYVADRNHLDERRKHVNEKSGRWGLADLARSLGDVGSWDEANAAWLETADASRRVAENLTDLAEQSADRGETSQAATLFRASLSAPIPEAIRNRSLARLATLEPGRKLPDQQSDGLILTASGQFVRLDEYVADPENSVATAPVGLPFAPRRPPADWVPARSAELAPPVTSVESVQFPNPRCVALLPLAGEFDLPGLSRDVAEKDRHLVVTDGRVVYGYRPRSDRPAWFSELPAGLSPTHAAADRDRLILVGPRGVVSLRLSDGTLGPPFIVPEAEPLPASGGFIAPRWSRPYQTAAKLSSFVLAGSRVVARLGDHHLIGIDPNSGRAAWLLDGGGRPRYNWSPFVGAPAFAPHLGTDGRSVLAQLTTGQRVAVAGDSGRMATPRPTALLPWSTPPALGPDGGMVVADGAGTLRLLTDVTSGTVGWTAEDREYEASRDGRPPAARWINGSLLTVAYRNYGVEVNRLRSDRANEWRIGGRTGGGPLVLPVEDFDPWAADADEQYVFLPAGGKILAVVWRTGKPVWSVDLGEVVGPAAAGVRWQVRAGRRATFAYPRIAIPYEQPADVLLRSVARFWEEPSVRLFPSAAIGLYDAWAVRSAPLIVLDPDTGTPLQRLDFPTTGPAVAVHLGPDSAVVATSGGAHWLK